MKDFRVIEIIDLNLCSTCPFAGKAWHKAPGQKTGGWMLHCLRKWCDNWAVNDAHQKQEYTIPAQIIAQIDALDDE